MMTPQIHLNYLTVNQVPHFCYKLRLTALRFSRNDETNMQTFILENNKQEVKRFFMSAELMQV